MTALAVNASAPVAREMEVSIRTKFDEILKEVPSRHFYSAANMRKLLDKYSEADLKLIYFDFCEIREQTFKNASKGLDYMVTAGGPAAGKSTILENILEKKHLPPEDNLDTSVVRAYIDPDRSCMRQMEHTFKNDISTDTRDPQQAYEHWRDASNFLANVYLAIALDKGYAIAHGSTMATPFAKNAMTSIKNVYNYTVTIIHVTCDENLRAESEKRRREGGIFQCTDIDFGERQKMFFTLLGDYISCANKVLFCYRHEMDKITWAAKVEPGKLLTYDKAALDKIKEAHVAKQGEEF